MHIATFIEKFEVDEKYENKTKTDEKVHLVNTGKTISIKGKKYIEKMVQKLILVGGLGIDDQEIMKIDVFNLETQQWESGPRGPYKDLRLEFPFTTEFETSVVLDNPLTGESNIIIYKKDALNPLQVIPLIQRNTYDIDGHIIPELCNYSEDKFEESSTSDTIRINTQKFDEKLRFLNRKIIYPKMRIFGPNLLISGYCSEHNKDIVLKDHPDNEMISVETLLPDTIPKARLDVLDKHTEKNLVFKSFCFSLVNGKWIEINCECLGDRKCEHHMLSEVFVWASHHKLLFIGSSDYQKHPKTSTIGLNRSLLPDTIPKARLDVLDKHTEKNLVFKSFCFSLVNGKWIEINCECLGDRKCEHHMLSEVFVWASHHKLLFIGSSDYQKHLKTSIRFNC